MKKLKTYTSVEDWGSKFLWKINFLDDVRIWRRTGVEDTKEDCEKAIKECIKNFKC